MEDFDLALPLPPSPPVRKLDYLSTSYTVHTGKLRKRGGRGRGGGGGAKLYDAESALHSIYHSILSDGYSKP